jgi:hypothetical protein
MALLTGVGTLSMIYDVDVDVDADADERAMSKCKVMMRRE